MESLRILFVPNEDGSFRQVGFRRPLADLLNAGLVSEVSVFSLQWRIRNGGDPEQHRQDLIRRVTDFKPNLILMQHLGTTGLRDLHFRAMRAAGEFSLIYYEADPYSRFMHPLPRPARAAGRAADVVFTVGTGIFRRNFFRSGAADVRWSPSVFDPERYRKLPVSENIERDHDIVVVANRNSPRFRGHPNWKDRIRFVSLLQERFKDRLAIYGKGWTGSGAMGPVEFSEQNRVIQSAWISANWDHYANEPSYFSNRLPISLAAGTIHATTHHPGYDDIFPNTNRSFLILERTPEALVDAIEDRLDMTTAADRIRSAKESQKFAYANFRTDDHLVKILNYRSPVVDPRLASANWSIDGQPLQDL